MLRGGRGENQKIVQIAAFPILFATDSLKKLQNFKCVILLLVALNHFKGIQLPIMSLLYKS